MNPFSTLPFQAAQSQGGGGMMFYVMLAAIGLIWFFLVIRPQNQRQKGHDDALKSAGKGDQVITTGGLHGKITAVGEDTFTLDVATFKGRGAVEVTVSKSKIESFVKPDEKKAEATGDPKGEARSKGGKKS
jgi:preprotein translocase subunit YajC